MTDVIPHEDDLPEDSDGYLDPAEEEEKKKQANKKRFIPLNTGRLPDDSYVTNYIRTTKYTLFTFIPQNLFEQFQKPANLYFLIIAILSSFPFSPKTPLVSILPLVFVLSVTAVKEGFEDWNRYKSDVEINNTKVLANRTGSWERITWTEVKVGDLVKVVDGEFFPADLLLLQSSAQQGICNIETSNLDGETNLKIKQAVAPTYDIQCGKEGDDYPSRIRATLESDGPNERMDKNSWKGNLIKLNGLSEPVPLTFTQLLLRGCMLKNTKWIIGFVVFTGLETKLMLQNKGKKLKRSRVDRIVDKSLYVIFSIQACLCIFGAVAYSIWLHNNAKNNWYLPFEISNINIDGEAAEAFMTYLVLLDLLVPISLYVSMELVKAAQALYINLDIDMYYPVNDIPARARTSNLNEELGQVSYVFSDKTGTLTRNEMEFLRCSIGGIAYGPGEEDKAGDHPPRLPPQKDIPPLQKQFRFGDNRVLGNLTSKHATAKQIDQFLTLLAVCHTVVPEYPDCEDPDHVHALTCRTPCKYQAASPDELALVMAASQLQYFFHHREPVKFNLKNIGEIQGQRVKVNIMGEQVDFSVLEILEFNSTRKRMSVIVLDPRDKKIKIFCKGADNVIRERCSKKSLQKLWKTTEKQLQDMAVEGLRTLCVGYRIIPKKEFAKWWEVHTRAKSSMGNREAEVNASSAQIEREFELIGATAIEDRLQDGVPETIAKLAQAGMKIWVLTGDKVETAINIGRSCRLLTPKMRGKNLLVVDIDESLEDEQAKAETLEALQHSKQFLDRTTKDNKENVAMVVSGKALGFVFPIRKLDEKKREIIPPAHVLEEEKKLQLKFLAICSQCKAIICCRMSPKQKSQIVTLVRENTDAVTLAIGDGANDVAMIEAAHVGIGIEGLEGKQAVMASDYAIAQFRFLLRLLLVHGAWSYRRLSLLILYSFYKNVTISMLGIWFAFYSGFSAQVYLDAISGALYNMTFTAFPVLCAAVFNRDVSKVNMLKYPELYMSGPLDEKFNISLLMLYIFQGSCHSLVLFFFTIFTFDVTTLPDGTDNDLWIMSTATYTCLVLLANYKIALQTTTWVFLTHLFLWLTVITWFLWMLLYTALPDFTPDMYWVFYRLCRMGNFWFLVLIAPITCILPDLAWEYIRRTYFFTKTDIIQEREAGYKTGPDLAFLDTNEMTGGSMSIDAKARQAVELEEIKQDIMSSGADEPTDPKTGIPESKKGQGWAKIAAKVKGDHLGYVPFLEDEQGEAYVMGQKEFLERYLVIKNKRAVELETAADGRNRMRESRSTEDYAQ